MDITDAEQNLVNKLMKLDCFVELYYAAKSFCNIIMGKSVGALIEWIKQISSTSILKLKTLIKGIKRDMEAVKNAIKYPVSNGIVEGFAFKLKMVKRVMFGIAELELLKRGMILT